MYHQVVESCDCVDEETECSDARVQGEERIQQVLRVAGNTSEQFAIGISAYYYTLMSIHYRIVSYILSRYTPPILYA